MRFFNKPSQPDGDGETDRLLDALGNDERDASPVRPGRFAPIAARLADRKSGTAPASSSLRLLLLGGGTAVATAATFGVLALVYPQPNPATVITIREATPNAAIVQAQNAASTYTAQNLSQIDAARMKAAGDFEASADPVFLSSDGSSIASSRFFTTVPFAVKIKNRGAAFSAKIVVTSGSTGIPQRTYTFPIYVAGGGRETREIVYAGIGPISPRDHYDISLVRPEMHYSLLSNYVETRNNDYSQANIAIIDTRYGALVPRRGKQSVNETPQYRAYTVLPANAPDFVDGYSPIDILALGRGSDRLSDAQWNAIRDWVKDGGSLVLLGGDAMASSLEVPAVRELSPVLVTESKPILQDRSRVLRIDGGRQVYYPATSPINLAVGLKPDAEPMNGLRLDEVAARRLGNGSVTASRHFGSGRVIYIGYDPTTEEYRDSGEALNALWNMMSRSARSEYSAETIRTMGVQNPWVGVAYDSQGKAYTYALSNPASLRDFGGNDPFRIALPPLQTVILVFLGYFVLVVPISFVVLKHRRSLQLAWATGPTLALAFAGGLTLATAGLYRAPLSHRTAGIVSLEAGDGVARFHGFTEFFTPQAGRYTFDVPGSARSLDFAAVTGATESNQGGSRELSTTAANGNETPPALDLPSLSFRRIYHSQTMQLGSGITANLRLNDKGQLVGTIDNNTGLALDEARIGIRGKTLDYEWKRSDNNTDYSHLLISHGRPGPNPPQPGSWQQIPSMLRFDLGKVSPGHSGICVTRSQKDIPMTYSSTNPEGYQSENQAWRMSNKTPVLIAVVNGESFGPRQLGRSLSGSSVTLLARLPVLDDSTPASYTVKGGANR